jgi:hypothetical protein
MSGRTLEVFIGDHRGRASRVSSCSNSIRGKQANALIKNNLWANHGGDETPI